MEPLIEKLRSSREQLFHEGLAFVSETRDAGLGFINHTREAGEAAVLRTRDAGATLVAALQSEVGSWGAYLRARRELIADEAKEARSQLNTRALERRLLSTVHKGLSEIDGQVGQRLDNLTTETVPAKGAKGKKLPLGDYENLTAKDIVARLDALSASELKALYDYERRHKGRATVLRATKQRLAA